MAPKTASKTATTGGKAPVGGKAPAEKRETTAPLGEKKKKKRTKARKETYSSYIYKGEFSPWSHRNAHSASSISQC